MWGGLQNPGGKTDPEDADRRGARTRPWHAADGEEEGSVTHLDALSGKGGTFLEMLLAVVSLWFLAAPCSMKEALSTI